MGGHGKSPLMEVSKRHDVPFRRLWLLLLTGQLPLLGGGQRAKEASVDEALQAPKGDVGFVPRVHCDSGSSTRKKAAASLMAGAVRVSEALAIGGGGWQCEGEKAEYGILGANLVVL